MEFLSLEVVGDLELSEVGKWLHINKTLNKDIYIYIYIYIYMNIYKQYVHIYIHIYYIYIYISVHINKHYWQAQTQGRNEHCVKYQKNVNFHKISPSRN